MLWLIIIINLNKILIHAQLKIYLILNHQKIIIKPKLDMYCKKILKRYQKLIQIKLNKFRKNNYHNKLENLYKISQTLVKLIIIDKIIHFKNNNKVKSSLKKIIF